MPAARFLLLSAPQSSFAMTLERRAHAFPVAAISVPSFIWGDFK
jgi:hypothetical protein